MDELMYGNILEERDPRIKKFLVKIQTLEEQLKLLAIPTLKEDSAMQTAEAVIV